MSLSDVFKVKQLVPSSVFIDLFYNSSQKESLVLGRCCFKIQPCVEFYGADSSMDQPGLFYGHRI